MTRSRLHLGAVVGFLIALAIIGTALYWGRGSRERAQPADAGRDARGEGGRASAGRDQPAQPTPPLVGVLAKSGSLVTTKLVQLV